MQRAASPLASEIGFPTSRVIACANASWCSAMTLAHLYRCSARAGPESERHPPSAASAAATAARASSGVPRGVCATTSRESEGLRSVIQSSPVLGTQRPPR